MLSVIIGAPTYKVRNRDAGMLMNFGFSKFEGRKVLVKDEDVENIYISKNTDKFFIAKAKDDLIAIIPKGENKEIEKKININEVKKEYKAGEIVGKCEIYLGEDKIGEVELYSDRDIKLGGIFENFKFNMKNMFRKGI